MLKKYALVLTAVLILLVAGCGGNIAGKATDSAIAQMEVTEAPDDEGLLPHELEPEDITTVPYPGAPEEDSPKPTPIPLPEPAPTPKPDEPYLPTEPEDSSQAMPAIEESPAEVVDESVPKEPEYIDYKYDYFGSIIRKPFNAIVECMPYEGATGLIRYGINIVTVSADGTTVSAPAEDNFGRNVLCNAGDDCDGGMCFEKRENDEGPIGYQPAQPIPCESSYPDCYKGQCGGNAYCATEGDKCVCKEMKPPAPTPTHVPSPPPPEDDTTPSDEEKIVGYNSAGYPVYEGDFCGDSQVDTQWGEECDPNADVSEWECEKGESCDPVTCKCVAGGDEDVSFDPGSEPFDGTVADIVSGADGDDEIIGEDDEPYPGDEFLPPDEMPPLYPGEPSEDEERAGLIMPLGDEVPEKPAPKEEKSWWEFWKTEETAEEQIDVTDELRFHFSNVLELEDGIPLTNEQYQSALFLLEYLLEQGVEVDFNHIIFNVNGQETRYFKQSKETLENLHGEIHLSQTAWLLRAFDWKDYTTIGDEKYGVVEIEGKRYIVGNIFTALDIITVSSPDDVNQFNEFVDNTYGIVTKLSPDEYYADSFFDISVPVEGLDGVFTLNFADIWKVRPNPAGPAIGEVGRSQTSRSSVNQPLLQGSGDDLITIPSTLADGMNIPPVYYGSTDGGKTWRLYNQDGKDEPAGETFPISTLLGRKDISDEDKEKLEDIQASNIILTGGEEPPEPPKPGASLGEWVEGKSGVPAWPEPEPEPEPEFEPGAFEELPGSFFEPFFPRYGQPEGGFTPIWPTSPYSPGEGSSVPSGVVIETIRIQVSSGFSVLVGVNANLDNAEEELDSGASIPTVVGNNVGLVLGAQFGF